jgi:hypothetical protein
VPFKHSITMTGTIDVDDVLAKLNIVEKVSLLAGLETPLLKYKIEPFAFTETE